MFCATCGTPNSDTASICSACARPMKHVELNALSIQPDLNVPPPPPPSTASASGSFSYAAAPALAYTQPSATAQPHKTMGLFGKIAIIPVSLLAIVFAMAAPLPGNLPETQADGYRIGRLITAFLFPFLIAYLIAGRRKRRNPNLFAGLFCGIALFFLLVNAAGSLGTLKAESTDQKVSRLMREAAGLQQVRKSFFAEPKFDTRVRDLFKEIFSINKEYQDAVGKLNIGLTARLNTPQSFADPASVADGLQVLHAAYDLDALQEQRMQKILDNFKHGFDDLSSSDRETVRHGFEEGLNEAMPARQRAISTEKTWIDAMDDVYSYAQSQHSNFITRNGQVAITDNDVREEFNRRVHTLNATRTEFVQAKDAFDKMQNASLNRMGVNREQTGLH